MKNVSANRTNQRIQDNATPFFFFLDSTAYGNQIWPEDFER